MKKTIYLDDALNTLDRIHMKSEDTWLDFYRRAIYRLNDLPSVQQWIPISERKPEKCNYYLVTDSGSVGEAYYDSDRRWWADGNKLKDVTAWMPLPEPYKGDLKNG